MPRMLEDQTSSGNSSTFNWPGGIGTFAVWGTFDSATVKLQVLGPNNDDSTWIDVGSDVELTADGVGNFQLATGCQIRANVSGGGGSQSVNAEFWQ